MAEATVQTLEMPCSPEEAFRVAADLDRYTEWASGIRSVEVLERDTEDRASRARFVVDAMVKEISYVLVYEYDEPRAITWRAEPGADLEEMKGSYTFTSLPDGGTEVVYALRARPAFTIPGFLRRQVERQITGTALRGLRRRIEEVRIS